MQAIQKKEPNSDELPKYYFRTWNFSGPKETAVVEHENARGGRCVMCHVSGPRSIEPLKNPAFKTELGGVTSLAKFNDTILHRGPLDYSPYYDPKFFPSHLKVGEGKCTTCHDGKDRQSLAFSVDRKGHFFDQNIHRKVIEEKSMPLQIEGDELTDQDRQKLVQYVRSDHQESSVSG